VSEALAHMTKILFAKISSIKPEELVYINASNAGLVLPSDVVAKKVAAISTFEPKWSYHKILEHLKEICSFQGKNDVPDYKLGPLKVAKHFEVV